MSFLVNCVAGCFSGIQRSVQDCCAAFTDQVTNCAVSAINSFSRAGVCLASAVSTASSAAGKALYWADEKTLKVSPSVVHISNSLGERRYGEAGLGFIQLLRGVTSTIAISAFLKSMAEGDFGMGSGSGIEEIMLTGNIACNFFLEFASAYKAKDISQGSREAVLGDQIEENSLSISRILNESFLEKLINLNNTRVVSKVFRDQFYSSSLLTLVYGVVGSLSAIGAVSPVYTLSGSSFNALAKFIRYNYFNRYLTLKGEESLSQRELIARGINPSDLNQSPSPPPSSDSSLSPRPSPSPELILPAIQHVDSPDIMIEIPPESPISSPNSENGSPASSQDSDRLIAVFQAYKEGAHTPVLQNGEYPSS